MPLAHSNTHTTTFPISDDTYLVCDIIKLDNNDNITYKILNFVTSNN